MEDRVEKILNSLSKSKFRSGFHLKEKDIQYIKEKGLTKIKIHAYDFVNKRLKDVKSIKDGKQTPTKGHPVFIAQHATATCCRGCLEKWHKINKNKSLSDTEINYIVYVIMKWIIRECKNAISKDTDQEKC